MQLLSLLQTPLFKPNAVLHKQTSKQVAAIENSGRTLTINSGSSNPDLTVNGTLVNRGTLTSSGTALSGAGSTYQHNTKGGAIPTATWNATSTVLVTGVAANTPSGLSQSFGNLTWNHTSQTIFPVINFTTINGNFTMAASGSPGILLGGTVNIGGNLNITGGKLYLTYNNTTTVKVSGNVSQSGGTLIGRHSSPGASILNVAGNWTRDGGAFTPDYSIVNFNGTGARSLGGSASTSFNNVTVNNASGMTMSADQTVTGVLTLTSGKLDTGSNVLSLDCSASITGASASRYILGNLKKNYCATGSFTYPTGTSKGYSPVAATLTALGTTPSSLQIRAVQSTASGLTDSKALDRYWTLTETGDVTTNLTFTYLAGDVDGNESDYRIYRGTTKVCGVACVDEVNHTATISGVTQFSDWSMGEGGATPTNITLLSFNAKLKDSKVQRNWKTGNELNTIGFNVWRAAKRDGTHKKLNKQLINAKSPGELTGNAYSYRNKKAKAGKTYFFKFEAIHADGTSEWSDIRRVNLP